MLDIRQVSYTTLLNSIESVPIYDLACYWEKLRGERAIPGRKDLDPLNFPAALPYLWIIELMDNGDLIHRLVGEVVQGDVGTRMVGKTTTELYGLKTDALFKEMAQMIRRKKCVLHGISAAQGPPEQLWVVERMGFPLAGADGERVDFILGVSQVLRHTETSVLNASRLVAQIDPATTTFYVPDETIA